MPNDAVSNLGKWLWYLIPANPILVRVVHGGSRRIRDLWYRFGYLLILFLVFLFSFMGSSSQMSGSLSEVAKTATQIFTFVSWTQLLLMCFLAPVFTAGAITQEKDAETFNILLTTPLSNAQIIFGSLLSRLFFVIMMLFSGLPIFCITMLYGGVTFRQILLSFTIAGATATITGSLAILISMLKVGTRRTIFSFYLLIGCYLMAVYLLGRAPFLAVPEAPLDASGSRQMSWLTPLHPFLALEVGLSVVPAPTLSDVAHYGWPTKYLLAYPHGSYALITLLASLVMITCSMMFVRRGAREGEMTWWTRVLQRVGLGANRAIGERRRKPTRVWNNPIAWREATTRASAASSGVTRYGLIIGGLLAALAILIALISGRGITAGGGATGVFGVSDARYYLMWLVQVQLVLILLVAANASATSMTKERESNTMDILLSTPLTSKAIVWGKLRGLIAYTLPILMVPLGSLLLFVGYDLVMLGRNTERVVHAEGVIELAGILLVYTALACVVGLQTSLKSKKTVRAVLVTVGVLTIAGVLLFVIVDEIVSSVSEIGPGIAPFTPFTAVKALINGQGDRGHSGYSFADRGSRRWMMFIGSAAAVAFYSLVVVFPMYKSLVRNFDMTVRKQTAS